MSVVVSRFSWLCYTYVDPTVFVLRTSRCPLCCGKTFCNRMLTSVNHTTSSRDEETALKKLTVDKALCNYEHIFVFFFFPCCRLFSVVLAGSWILTSRQPHRVTSGGSFISSIQILCVCAWCLCVCVSARARAWCLCVCVCVYMKYMHTHISNFRFMTNET